MPCFCSCEKSGLSPRPRTQPAGRLSGQQGPPQLADPTSCITQAGGFHPNNANNDQDPATRAPLPSLCALPPGRLQPAVNMAKKKHLSKHYHILFSLKDPGYRRGEAFDSYSCEQRPSPFIQEGRSLCTARPWTRGPGRTGSPAAASLPNLGCSGPGRGCSPTPVGSVGTRTRSAPRCAHAGSAPGPKNLVNGLPRKPDLRGNAKPRAISLCPRFGRVQ